LYLESKNDNLLLFVKLLQYCICINQESLRYLTVFAKKKFFLLNKIVEFSLSLFLVQNFLYLLLFVFVYQYYLCRLDNVKVLIVEFEKQNIKNRINLLIIWELQSIYLCLDNIYNRKQFCIFVEKLFLKSSILKIFNRKYNFVFYFVILKYNFFIVIFCLHSLCVSQLFFYIIVFILQDLYTFSNNKNVRVFFVILTKIEIRIILERSLEKQYIRE